MPIPICKILFFMAKTEFLIRQAQDDDQDSIVKFQLAMAQETEGLSLDATVLQQGVAAVFDNNNRGFYYVAESAGQIVGSLLLTFEWSDWRNGTILWIQSVYVSPSYRQKGIFSAMYQYIKLMVEEAEELKGIRLYVDRNNQVAQKVYERLGMNGQHYQLYEWMP